MADDTAPLEPAPPGEGPAHYRLSSATWAVILEEYKGGATARLLAEKWRVSEHAVRRRITQHGATKRDWGDQQAMAQARARAAALEAERAESPEMRAARLFLPPPEDDPDADHPGVLAKTAVLASGRAMKGRLWAEAKALAGLAETYSRLADRAVESARRHEPTIENLDLLLILQILLNHDDRVAARFERAPEGVHDPDADVKEKYFDLMAQGWAHVRPNLWELMLRAHAAEEELKRLGGTPKVNVTDVEIEDWVRDFLSGPPTQANFWNRTHKGRWPWRTSPHEWEPVPGRESEWTDEMWDAKAEADARMAGGGWDDD